MSHDLNIFRLKAVNAALANFSPEFAFEGEQSFLYMPTESPRKFARLQT